MQLVVALALVDPEGRILLQRRLPGKRHAGLWEFPGGKVESEEFPTLALSREVAEELSVKVDIADLEPVAFAQEDAQDNGPVIVLLLYTARKWSGQIEGLEGQEWGWFSLEEAAEIEKPPMDSLLLRRLAN